MWPASTVNGLSVTSGRSGSNSRRQLAGVGLNSVYWLLLGHLDSPSSSSSAARVVRIVPRKSRSANVKMAAVDLSRATCQCSPNYQSDSRPLPLRMNNPRRKDEYWALWFLSYETGLSRRLPVHARKHASRSEANSRSPAVVGTILVMPNLV